MTRWTDGEVALLTQLYPLTPMQELEVKVGRTACQIKNKAKFLGLRRDKSFLDATRFKRGARGALSHNWIQPGERRDDGRYIRVKLPDGSWVLEHRWVWEQANGPVPDDCVIVAKDGNIKNTALGNLMLVTRDMHCRFNQVRKYPAELQEVILAQHELNRAIRKKTDEK
ncbi:HNH endonuclease signature motif containing protein [Pseudomonas putida]|uniref:HNH endonuclease signature motif containing protein n=1 Tax=Pseudomonas putida TaxID=303 RepID=UPI0003689D9F|nr:HNH endonuclease signature motif containing protein [Pseudomonas putida]ANC82996.1 hypothetical protein KKK_19115 [Pseudomonas putida B6-2]